MYYFIVNPASGSGKGRAVWNTVRKELDRRKVVYRAFLLSKPGEARKLAGSFSGLKHPATVIVVGGDGTINEVVSGLSSFEHIIFACIPTGSGNDFVRGLGLERDPLRALDAILCPKKIRRINVGSADEGRLSFTVSAGFGYDAAVCHSVDKSPLKTALNRFRLGKLVYLLTALWQLIAMEPQTLEIMIEPPASRASWKSCAQTCSSGTGYEPPAAGTHRPAEGDTLCQAETIFFENAYFAAAMNLRYEGGGFMFAPEALPADDCLDLIVANDISRLRVLYLLPLALSGKHVGHRGVHILRCKKAALHSPKPLTVHTDGEVPGFAKEVTFSLREEKLAVILR